MFSALALTLTLAALPPWMTGETQPEDLKITVVTFSPGDTLVEWWGHTSFIVEDQKRQQAALYNFGMFGPREGGDTAGFLKDFIKGRLIFWVDDESVSGTFNLYKNYLKRDIRLQELDLEPSEAMVIAKRLGTHVLPENRYYRYHHYNDNCSTRPRDFIDEAIGGQLKAATSGPSDTTLRELTLRYSMVNPPMSLVLDFLQADSLDQPMILQRNAYLPDELEKQLAAQKVVRADGTTRPLVKRQWNYFESGRTRPPARAPNWVLSELLIGLVAGGWFVGLAAWSLKRRAGRIVFGLFTAVVGLVLGLFGSALAFLMCFTDHDVTYWNENVLQASPVSLALFPLGLMLAFGSARAPKALRSVSMVLAVLSLTGVVMKVLPMADQNNWNVLALLVPINLSAALAWWWLPRRVAPTPATASGVAPRSA